MQRAARATRAALAVLMLAAAFASPSRALADGAPAEAPALGASPGAGSATPKANRTPRLDHSGRKRVGMASYYARRFSGRKMADGTPMRPESDNAASRTLPLGTTALVTNLKNGKAAVVTIRDRGPYAKGRIIDLSPRTAQHLGMLEVGVASVEVTPLSVPPSSGSVKAVAALSERSAAGPQRKAF